LPSTQGGTPLIRIREYEERDWDGICRVHDLARPDELRGSCDSRAFIPLAQDPEVPELKRCVKYVACDDDRIVGFVGINGDYLSGSISIPSITEGDRAKPPADRPSLAVRPHGRSFSTADVRARRLYESEGFNVVRTYQGDNSGYPCTCMRMSLSGAV
jgi:hypothetical protein